MHLQLTHPPRNPILPLPLPLLGGIIHPNHPLHKQLLQHIPAAPVLPPEIHAQEANADDAAGDPRDVENSGLVGVEFCGDGADVFCPVGEGDERDSGAEGFEGVYAADDVVSVHISNEQCETRSVILDVVRARKTPRDRRGNTQVARDRDEGGTLKSRRYPSYAPSCPHRQESF